MRLTRRLLLELDEMRSQRGIIIQEEDTIIIYIPIVFPSFIREIKNKKKMVPFLNLTIDKQYPFRAPRVKYFDKDIQNIYKVSLQNELNELINNEVSCILCKKNSCNSCRCMCCSTITCKNNWDVLMKLIDIINEFKNFIEIKCRLIERIHCKKVQAKFISQIPIKYLPIHNYL